MRLVKVSLLFLIPLVAGCSATPSEQQQPAAAPTSRAVLFERARLIVGDGSTIENAAFVVENKRFTRVGRTGEVQAPEGAARVDLTGKTVMPAIINGHTHLGYDNLRSDAPDAWENYTHENLIETMQRMAYYGVGTAMTMGNDGGHGDIPWKLREEEIPNGARYRSAGGALSQPGEGHMGIREPSWYHVTSEAEVRTAIQDLATHKPDMVKILVDDRLGEIPQAMPPSLYKPLMEEAHKHNLRVAAHMMSLDHAKGLLRANMDGFAHMIRDRSGTKSDIDDEFIELLKKRQKEGVCNPPTCDAPWPDVFFMPLLPNPPNRGGYKGFISYTAEDIPWMAETLPPQQIQRMRDALTKPQRGSSDRDSGKIYAVQIRNLKKINDLGLAKIGFGTDGGADGAGWNAHIEMADMTAAGMTPMQVITAATKTTAEILRIHNEVGSVADGKSADFLVLDANPLEDITNTRKINKVYLRGNEVDRSALRTTLSRQ